MLMRPTNEDHRGSHPAIGAPRRRRGTVLILVMTVLGVLFVTGIAFMATMNFEAKLVQIEQDSTVYEQGLGEIERAANQYLKASFVNSAGRPAVGETLGQPLTIAAPPGTTTLVYQAATPTFAELPQVNGLIAASEPQYPNVPNGAGLSYQEFVNQFAFRGFTDLEQLQQGYAIGWSQRKVTPLLPTQSVSSLEPYPRLADADGDGMVDTWQYDLSRLGVTGEGARALARMVNPTINSTGRVHVGLRIVPHGAFVDLNQSHPVMIRTVFNGNQWVASAWDQRQNAPYSPLTEESSLRRRWLLPPKYIPQSGVQGSRLLDPNFDPVGDGDFAGQLFGPPSTAFSNGETVFPDQHQYWMYDAATTDNQIDPEYPPWKVRMDRSDVNRCDRRSLVTTVSYDDQLSRGAMLNGEDVIDLMHSANRVASAADCDAALPFELAEYPHTLTDDYRIPNQACGCPPDLNCVRDPRKGRLRLSLPWLTTGLSSFASTTQRAAIRERLIYDSFLIMLLRARDPEFGVFDNNGNWNRTDPQWLNLTRAAASLTANLLDFVDADGVPTAIALRNPRINDAAAGGRPLPQYEYVFGVERQPYITEVASRVDDVLGGGDGSPDISSFYAVELFNPYDVDVEVNGLKLNVPSGTEVQLTGSRIPPRGFVVFYSGAAPPPPQMNGDVRAVSGLLFRENDSVFLTRLVPVVDPNGQLAQKRVAIDQFDLTGGNVGRVVNGSSQPTYSTERVVTQARPWTATVPVDSPTFELPADTETLGKYNQASAPDVLPVQVDFANTVVNWDSADAAQQMRQAFPTTGSLLLLCRYANREYNFGGGPLAFTSQLRTGSAEIDNGRLPVFDTANNDHVDPAVDPTKPNVSPPAVWPQDVPGETFQLPWGQLVFDYFTALPLSNPGPFENVDPQVGPSEASAPKVDEEGLRVHGRINLNAAPWKVISGLPLMPVSAFAAYPDSLRNKIGYFAQLDPTLAKPIGEPLAKAIVAYRDAREICKPIQSVPTDACGDTTGNYDAKTLSTAPPTYRPGRGWTHPTPAFRRGTGFVSVGELLNVRHPDAYVDPAVQPFISPPYSFSAYSAKRMDLGMTSAPAGQRDYLAAVAKLVAMGDWATVRSHVFTVYASVRGEVVDGVTTEAEVTARAVRMQETVDRLPTFLGESEPVRIGERSVGRYLDVEGN